MKLDAYLKHHHISADAFANKIGVTRSQVNKLRQGVHWPSRETAIAIMTATNGWVTPEDFLEGVNSVKFTMDGRKSDPA